MKISYRKDRKLGRREKPQTSTTSTKQAFITLLYIISPGPGLRAQLIGTLDWRCANLDELPVPVLIQRKAAVPAQLLEPAGVGIWAAEKRRLRSRPWRALLTPTSSWAKPTNCEPCVSLMPPAVYFEFSCFVWPASDPDCCYACVLSEWGFHFV